MLNSQLTKINEELARTKIKKENSSIPKNESPEASEKMSSVKNPISSDVFLNFKMTTAVVQKSILETASKMVPQAKSEYVDEMTASQLPIFSELSQSWEKTWSEYHKEIGRRNIPPKRLEQMRSYIKENARRHTIFAVFGNYFSIRKALLDRGWMEKIDDYRNNVNSFDDEEIYAHLPIQGPLENKLAYIKRCERRIYAILLQNTTPDLFWNYRLTAKEMISLPKTTLINRIPYSRFSTKAGLSSVLKDAYWYTDNDIGNLNFPRCYIVNEYEQLQDFIADFRLTASMSLLKTFLQLYQLQGEAGVLSPTGSLKLYTVIHALQICFKFIGERKHEDIDKTDKEVTEAEWNKFLDECYSFTQKNYKFMEDKEPTLPYLEKVINRCLTEIKQYCPQFDIDGQLNIWIAKPAARCRGIGIKMMNNYQEISEYLNNINTKGRYVFQKYIETPLLIHGYKFDIRQWFLVTSVCPLSVWMYKVCYFRFSSKKFDLHNYHEIIHLTNNSVQTKYRNFKRESDLPTGNMWELHQFKNYLKLLNKPYLWEEHIYPQIKEIIIGTLMSSEDYIIDARANCFQMFGADLMIDSNYCVWLIEINSCPQMAPTSPITTKLCPQCLEDVIKVVVDRRDNMCADTGNFELIYNNPTMSLRNNFHQFIPNMSITGKKMRIYNQFLIPYYNNYQLIDVNSASQLIIDTSKISLPSKILKVDNDTKKKLITINNVFNNIDNIKDIQNSKNIANTVDYERKMRDIELHYTKLEKSNSKRVYAVHIGKPVLGFDKNEPKIKVKSKVKIGKNANNKNNQDYSSSNSDDSSSSPVFSKDYAFFDILKSDVEEIKRKIYKNFSYKSLKNLYVNKSFIKKLTILDENETDLIPISNTIHISHEDSVEEEKLVKDIKNIYESENNIEMFAKLTSNQYIDNIMNHQSLKDVNNVIQETSKNTDNASIDTTSKSIVSSLKKSSLKNINISVKKVSKNNILTKQSSKNVTNFTENQSLKNINETNITSDSTKKPLKTVNNVLPKRSSKTINNCSAKQVRKVNSTSTPAFSKNKNDSGNIQSAKNEKSAKLFLKSSFINNVNQSAINKGPKIENSQNIFTNNCYNDISKIYKSEIQSINVKNIKGNSVINFKCPLKRNIK